MSDHSHVADDVASAEASRRAGTAPDGLDLPEDRFDGAAALGVADFAVVADELGGHGGAQAVASGVNRPVLRNVTETRTGDTAAEPRCSEGGGW